MIETRARSNHRFLICFYVFRPQGSGVGVSHEHEDMKGKQAFVLMNRYNTRRDLQFILFIARNPYLKM